MVRWIKTAGSRVALALAWTLALGAARYFGDRGLLGAGPERGWVEVAELADIPAGVGPVVVPAYFPDTLSWPPARVLYRNAPRPGWWLGVRPRDAVGVVLWIGDGEPPVPEALGDVGRCLDEHAHPGCPPGWRRISKSLNDHRAVFVVTSLDSALATRVLDGLVVAH